MTHPALRLLPGRMRRCAWLRARRGIVGSATKGTHRPRTCWTTSCRRPQMAHDASQHRDLRRVRSAALIMVPHIGAVLVMRGEHGIEGEEIVIGTLGCELAEPAGKLPVLFVRERLARR